LKPSRDTDIIAGLFDRDEGLRWTWTPSTVARACPIARFACSCLATAQGDLLRTQWGMHRSRPARAALIYLCRLLTAPHRYAAAQPHTKPALPFILPAVGLIMYGEAAEISPIRPMDVLTNTGRCLGHKVCIASKGDRLAAKASRRPGQEVSGQSRWRMLASTNTSEMVRYVRGWM
jgi:hypothetical protein